MPPIQHTFGTTGNAPSHPGAGATQTPQSRPLPNNFSQPTSSSSSSSSPLPVPPPPPPAPKTNESEGLHHNPTTPSTGGPIPYAYDAEERYLQPTTYSQNTFNINNPYNSYEGGQVEPQEPIPAYTRNGPNESPDLIAARREYLDVKAQIQKETIELTNLINTPPPNPTKILSIQDSIRKLYIRQGSLLQRIQDLQDPYSYAFQQSQAMTTMNPTHQTPLMYDPDQEAQDRNRALTLGNYTVTSRDRKKGIACLVILLFVLTVLIVGLVLKKRRS
ncbi:hypothetical protein TWF506_002979 [Arthrobotrys conoides]|uniref:Uncharacterized protein n=1 Tax=Arthrobotrys conoides TaxID=74498 RepID=A0AAN8NDW8_9PEZI